MNIVHCMYELHGARNSHMYIWYLNSVGSEHSINILNAKIGGTLYVGFFFDAFPKWLQQPNYRGCTRGCTESMMISFLFCEFSPIQEMVLHLCTYFGGGIRV